ncbi:hypothetical protein AB832_07815 [Flavobacteriaceae bacterium (ex Bugula neritina AB1)]|nr:hypothetical protein AB832_07815 [Flavobacteriaceae bacterium (ex Bugula neritina AB1)]
MTKQEIITELETALNEIKNGDIERSDFLLDKISRAVHGLKKARKTIPLLGKKATVREGSKWIYAGHSFPILELYILHNGEFGVYKKGSMDLRLDLRGTQFEYRENKTNPEKPYHNTSTVINTEDLIISNA